MFWMVSNQYVYVSGDALYDPAYDSIDLQFAIGTPIISAFVAVRTSITLELEVTGGIIEFA